MVRALSGPNRTRRRVYPKVNRSARTPGDILDRIVRTKEAEVAALRPRGAAFEREAAAAAPARPFRAALRRPAVALIGEFKRRSPSAGTLGGETGPAAAARHYAAAGAAAISVLTDAEYFGGSLADLRAAREAVDLPVLRKDFVIDEIQLFEARAAGADAVLLIARILDDARMAALLGRAAQLGMAALIEVHDATELDRALALGADLIGINNRDLATFRTDLAVSLELAPRVPPGAIVVAESGIHDERDVDRLAAAGVDAILVGEALMRAGEAGVAASLTAVPRQGRTAEARA